MNFGNMPIIATTGSEDKKGDQPQFPNGKSSLQFDEFINIIKDSCADRD
jgi:hypothetical protein